MSNIESEYCQNIKRNLRHWRKSMSEAQEIVAKIGELLDLTYDEEVNKDLLNTYASAFISRARGSSMDACSALDEVANIVTKDKACL